MALLGQSVTQVLLLLPKAQLFQVFTLLPLFPFSHFLFA